MHFTQQSVLITAGILALVAIALAMYTASQRKGK